MAEIGYENAVVLKSCSAFSPGRHDASPAGRTTATKKRGDLREILQSDWSSWEQAHPGIAI